MNKEDSIIHDLYSGKLNPSEREVYYSSEYLAIHQDYDSKEQSFLRRLDAKAREQYQGLQALRQKMIDYSEEEIFTYGFRIGVRLTAEAFASDSKEE